MENKIEEKAWQLLWTTYPKLRNLVMDGFAVPANNCAEEDANASKAACCAQPCAFAVRTVTATRQGFLTGKGQLC